MRRALLLVLAILAAPLTGCVGFSDPDPEQARTLENRAQTTTSTGGVEGVVTDAAVQPVTGATVELQEVGRTTRTASDGSYALSNVQPGAYTLEVIADGFVATTRQVQVQAGQVQIADVILAHEPSVIPYSQQIGFKGFVECSVRVVLGAALCAFPNALLGGNATNDRFLFPFPLEANPWQMVTEVRWDAGQPMGTHLDAIVEPDGLPNDGRTAFGVAEGESPLRVATDRARFAEVDHNTTRICDGEGEEPGAFAASREAYCNRNYIEDGGQAWVRIFVSEADPIPAGATVQQDYDLVITTFYNAPACEGYALFADETCPQVDAPPSPDPADDVGDDGEGDA